MAGRNKKSVETSTGKISKKDIESRKKQEEKLKLGREQLESPHWLSENAKKEFKRICEECQKIDLLDNLDLGILAIYCNAYDCYIEITNKLKKEYYTTENGGLNPLLNAQEKYIKQIIQCSSKLGLTAIDRLKLVIPNKEEPKENKFIELLKSAK